MGTALSGDVDEALEQALKGTVSGIGAIPGPGFGLQLGLVGLRLVQALKHVDRRMRGLESTADAGRIHASEIIDEVIGDTNTITEEPSSEGRLFYWETGMASVVGICNRALALIGEQPITALTDESEAARRCDLLYPDTRDAVLRAHPWNAAVARAELAALASAPAFGFSYQHSLPSDCVRLLRLKADDRRVTFKVETGRRVLADTSPLQVLYVKRIEDPNDFDALLVDVIAARLAHDLAYALAGSASLAGQMWELYQRKLVEARKADAQEGSADKLDADEWLDARF